MKTLSMLLLISFLFVNISCKKKEDNTSPECSKQNLLLGKWKFVSRKVTDYTTGLPKTPATNTTVNFDQESYIEFKSDNTFRWYEIYNNKVYKDLNGTTVCAWGDNFFIYSNQSTGTGIPENIKELTSTKLVFENHVLRCGSCGDYTTTITLELSKVK